MTAYNLASQADLDALAGRVTKLEQAGAPPVVVPPPVTAPAVGWYISDAVGCTNGKNFHAASDSPWEHVGGDWWDATGAKQGTSPYGSVDSPTGTATQVWSFDVTKLLADQSGAPAEFILVAPGRYIDGIGGTNPPIISVTHADGTVEATPVVVCMVLDGSTAQPVTGQLLALGGGVVGNAALRFAAPTGAVASARLTISSPKQFGGAHIAAKLYRLRQPTIPTTVEYGIAKAGQLSSAIFNMTLDTRPLSDFLIEPSTLDYTNPASYDLTAKDVTKYPAICMAQGKFVGDNLKTHSVVTLPSGKKAIKFDCLGPTEGAGQELVTDWIFQFMPDANGRLPQEMYVQWKMMLDPNFVIPAGSASNGGKWGLGFSHRTTMCGNGGAFCHSPPTQAGKMGWSSRGQHLEPSDKRDPAFGKMLIGSYDYNAVESQVPHMTGLLGALSPGVEYTIEKYVKMNTNDMTGATPALSDGITRMWINGVRALDRTGYKFRDNPPWTLYQGVPVSYDAGIREVWWNSWWGGLYNAPMHNTHYVRDVIIAPRYIGPA